MKMAKASQSDMEMAITLCSALEALDRRFLPKGSEGENDPEDFDREDDEHCGMALRHVLDILERGSIGRVIWGMYVLLDPENKVVDPGADSLEEHPETVAANEDAARYRWLRDRLIGADFDWNDSGTSALVFELPKEALISANCDKTIDDAMALLSNAGANAT